MLNEITSEIKESFRRGGTLVKLIYINLGIFVVGKLLFVIFSLAGLEGLWSFLFHRLAVPASPSTLITRPWTLITYMFFHFDFLHILFNMLWLYWFGRIFLHYFTEKQLLNTYFLGGLLGVAFYIAAFNIFPGLSEYAGGSFALGASASIMGICLATAVYDPEYTIYLFLIGPVKLKWIAVALIAMDVLFMMDSNAGGHIAHLGGAVYGIVFARKYKKGNDIGRGFERIMDWFVSLFKRRSKLKVTHRGNVRQESDHDYNARKTHEKKELDRILDKISKTGYASLSKKEKELLFKMKND
jgi:membrane associated rhomboid family serine protease